MNEYFHNALGTLAVSGKWFVICGLLFTALAWLFPSKPEQPYLRKDMKADSVYWFLGPLVYGPIFGMLVFYLVTSFFLVNATWLNHMGQSVIAGWPIVAQVVIMLLASDILQYWMHRLFHGETLWRFHSIHHSPKHVDWLTSARFHPVNILLYSTLMNAFVFLLGFSPQAYDALFLFNVLYSPLVHANVNWTYGPFKYVLASPVFHRWHHTHPDEGGNRNFAPTFPFLDVIFGTFYMPKGKRPENFGAHNDTVPDHFIGQLIYPFKWKKNDAAQQQEHAKPASAEILSR